jgi:hypothetical protein
LSADPLFVSAGADFHLLPGSPAINGGVMVSGIATDYDGTPRPQGMPVDISAYER